MPKIGVAGHAVMQSGTWSMAQSGTWTVQPGNTPNTVAWLTARPNPSQSFVNSAASTNATSIKPSAGTVYSLSASNTHATNACYVKLYNKASAPTVGTDVPVLVIPVPALSEKDVNLGAYGHRFATGIALAITGAAADTDTTAVGANDVKVATAYV